MGSVFAGIEKAEVYGSGQNIRPGLHTLAVRELVVHKSRQKSGITYFIAEFEVVASKGGRPTTAQEGAPPGASVPHEPGDVVSWVSDLSQPSSLGNIKAFALALAPNAAESEITAQTMDDLVASDQPARGIKVKADASVITTRKGSDFTKIKWIATPDEKPAVKDDGDEVPF